MTLQHAFYIDCMTSLKFAIPFIKTVKKIFNIDICLLFDSNFKSGKYNSISMLIRRLYEIIHENSIFAHDIANSAVDVYKLFCIENVCKSIRHYELFSFQNGFDYTSLAKNNKNATYLISNESCLKDVSRIVNKVLVQPVPVNYWDWNYNVDFIQKKYALDRKHVLLFYPENGHIDIFKHVYDFFRYSGFLTHVKQRRKSQVVNEAFAQIYYDDIWYPSESTFLTMIADICVGFGTSAYLEIVRLNKTFIDFTVTEYSKNYVKPKDNNLIECDSSSVLADLNRSLFDKAQDAQHCPCDYDKIKTFLLEIL